MVSPWFGDLLHPCDIISGQLSLQVFYFLIIHRQCQSFQSLLYKLLSLLILRLWSSWSPSRSHLVAPRCFLCLGSMVASVPFPRFSFPRQVWVAAMCSSGRRCPCPVCPSLPPCSLLIVQSRGNFRRVVSGVAFLPFNACWLLAMGVGLLHFNSFLSVSTFLVFSVVVFLWVLRVNTHTALHWPRISRVYSVPSPLPSPVFAGGSSGPGVLGFHGSGSLCSLPTLFVLSALLFLGELWDLLFIYIIFIYIMVSVFSPHFCTGLLLRGCYMWGNLLDGNRQYPLYGLHILYRHSSFGLSSYAVVWYWLQNDRHSVVWPYLSRPFQSLSPFG